LSAEQRQPDEERYDADLSHWVWNDGQEQYEPV